MVKQFYIENFSSISSFLRFYFGFELLRTVIEAKIGILDPLKFNLQSKSQKHDLFHMLIEFYLPTFRPISLSLRP